MELLDGKDVAGEEEEEEEEEEEGIETFSCEVCPDKVLKTVQHVEVHLKSKEHMRRLRYLKRNDGISKLQNNRDVEEEDLPKEVKAKIEAKKSKIESDRELREQRLKKKKEEKVQRAKDKLKAHRKLVKQRKWEREQATEKEAKSKQEPFKTKKIATK
ncbi:hypothetical protein BD408DRAFT_414464 [Parasitella parasitica]|nr:hypothetical protein BD408DRAFT_414464 [Parasitella parasitica]